MSKSRAKGTRWESELLVRLRDVFGPDVHRAPLRGTHDAGDYVGLPMVVEAKSTASPRLTAWAVTCIKAARFHRDAVNGTVVPWVIAWHGDRVQGEGPVAVLTLDYWLELERKARRDIS